MIRTGKGLTTTFIVLGLVVTGGIAYGLLDGQLDQNRLSLSAGLFGVVGQVG